MSHTSSFQTYLVGGAVRDERLGLPVKDRDWVVVGAHPEQLIAAGFKQVGADFPVFLHPETGEEYALARTERKTGQGYQGFTCYSAPDVTLEEDLQRRDLTINAMALAQDGTIIDPFNGQQDLKDGLLRHVSPAFSEDPLRVLRVARFAARLAPLGFNVAPDTMTCMRDMVSSGELNQLTPERVWQETLRALAETQAHVYFSLLRELGALAIIMPELDALFGVPQPEAYHPEIDCGVHALMSLEQASRLSDEPATRFAALVHDLGKALSPQELLPKHHGHEIKGIKPIKQLCTRLRTPNHFRDLAVHTSEYHTHVHRAFELRPQTLLKVLKAIDALRRPERFEAFLICCEADARGRTGFEDRDYPQAEFFRQAFAAMRSVNVKQVRNETGLDGKALGEAIDMARVHAIRDWRQDYLAQHAQ
ncbi:MAG: multifunctional CCA addition/repair protein [Oleiphilaceae bacterium]|nr:multifunctional CCA addition/repair protein [Oleiphilaceae bacterium]